LTLNRCAILQNANIAGAKIKHGAIESNLKSKHKICYVLSFLLIAITIILIQASVEVFGNTEIGYLKSISLEVGILILCTIKTENKIDLIFKICILIFSIFLSFFILHSGATIGAATSHKKISQENIELTNLTETRSKLIANHDTLPLNHTTKRNALMTEVKELDTKISAVLSLSKSSPAMTALNAATNTEIWSRAVFLLMNLFFGHLLAQRLRWGRESLT
jgi:hypothetical protein